MIPKIKTELIKKLKIAIEITENSPENLPKNKYAAGVFFDKLKDAPDKLKNDDNLILNALISWFTPASKWESFVGDTNLGNEIFTLLIKIRRKLKNDEQTEAEKINAGLKSKTKSEIFEKIQAILKEGKMEIAFALGKIHNIYEKELAEPWNELINSVYVSINMMRITTLRELFNATSISFRVPDFTSVLPQIGSLKNLKRLDLASENLTEIPKEIGSITGLEELNLKKNKLTILPPEIGNLKNLRKLGLDENKLSILPKEIALLKNLTSLSLSRNKFRKFPKEITSLTKLEGLFFSENEISELPENFKNLTEIKALNFNDNLFESVPESLKYLKKLQILNLQRNKFKTIPEFLEKLPNLDRLYADYGIFTEKQEKRFKLPPMEYGF